MSEVQRLGLQCNTDNVTFLIGYGQGKTRILGSVKIQLSIDNVEEEITAVVVPDNVQNKPILVGQNYTELPQIVVLKDAKTLTIMKLQMELPQAV